MSFTKKQPINTLKDSQAVDDIFVVKIKKGISPYTKGQSFQLILSDSSGQTIDYKYWGGNDLTPIKDLYDSIKTDSVVHVKGKVSTYNNKLQISSNDLVDIRPLENSEYDQGEFVKKAKIDVDVMDSDMFTLISSISDPALKEMLHSIYTDSNITEKIKTHPAAIEIHHNWVGGLMQHMIEMVSYCELTVKTHPSLNRDVVIAGVLLHDIGKIEEIEVTSRIKGTTKGQLLGHIPIGFSFVTKKMDDFKVNEDLRNKILHIIVSHHGKLEFGSPKTPMLPEAIVVHYADEMSSKVTEIIDFIEENKEATEDDFMYHRRKGHNIFLR